MDAAATDTSSCACCGGDFAETDLVSLRCHSDIGLCSGCIGWLAAQRGKFIRAVPMLATEDVAASAAFWAEAGFDVETYDEGFAAAHCDGIELHLANPTADGRDRGEAYLHAGDVDALQATWQAAGLDVSEVADQPWGMREFSVLDPGGNRVRIGHTSRTALGCHQRSVGVLTEPLRDDENHGRPIPPLHGNRCQQRKAARPRTASLRARRRLGPQALASSGRLRERYGCPSRRRSDRRRMGDRARTGVAARLWDRPR